MTSHHFLTKYCPREPGCVSQTPQNAILSSAPTRGATLAVATTGRGDTPRLADAGGILAAMDSLDEPVDPPTLARYERRAPSWYVRCLRCGYTEHWGKYAIRKWAVGRKWTFGRCARCNRWCCHVIEKRQGKQGVLEQIA